MSRSRSMFRSRMFFLLVMAAGLVAFDPGPPVEANTSSCTAAADTSCTFTCYPGGSGEVTANYTGAFLGGIEAEHKCNGVFVVSCVQGTLVNTCPQSNRKAGAGAASTGTCSATLIGVGGGGTASCRSFTTKNVPTVGSFALTALGLGILVAGAAFVRRRGPSARPAF